MRGAILSLLSICLASQEPTLTPVIKRARVHPNQAWITREATWTFRGPGFQRLRFGGLPGGLSLDGIRVQVEGLSGIRLGNVAVTQEQGHYETDAEAKRLGTEAERLQKRLTDLNLRSESLAQTRTMLANLKPEAGPSDAAALLDPKGGLELARGIQAQMVELSSKISTLSEEEASTRARLEIIRSDLAGREAAGTRNNSVVWVELEASAAGEARIQLDCATSAARWRPSFEVRLGEANIELLCYAGVSQASGEDWRDIGLEISNAEPGRVLRVPTPPSSVQLLYEAPGVVLAGRIEGRVTDRSSRPLSGVTLEATCESLKLKRTVVSDANGAFRLPLLPPAEYVVRATKNGHPSAMSYARVAAGQAVTLGFQLLPTTAGAVVEVVAQSASVDRSETKTSASFSANQGTLEAALESTPSRYEESGNLSRAWVLEGKKTLPSDAISRRMLLARMLSESKLRLRAIPRRSTEIFLTASLSPVPGFPWFPNTPTTLFRNGEQLGQIGLPRIQSGEGAVFSFGPVPGLRVQRQRIEATVAVAKGGRGRQWTLRERLLLVNELDREVEVEVQEPAIRSSSDRVRVEILPEATQATESGEHLVWRVTVPARGQSRIEEAWRITGPTTGFIPEIAALGLPTSD